MASCGGGKFLFSSCFKVLAMLVVVVGVLESDVWPGMVATVTG